MTGFAPQILSHIKLACLHFVNQPITYSEFQLQFQELVQIKEFILLKCQGLLLDTNNMAMNVASIFGEMDEASLMKLELLQKQELREPSPPTMEPSQLNYGSDTNIVLSKLNQIGSTFESNQVLERRADDHINSNADFPGLRRDKLRQIGSNQTGLHTIDDLTWHSDGMDKKMESAQSQPFSKISITQRKRVLSPSTSHKFKIDTLINLLASKNQVQSENAWKAKLD